MRADAPSLPRFDPEKRESELMESNTKPKNEPQRTIHHTEGGGHSVDAREILQSKRAQKLISEVASRLKVSRTDGSPR